MSTRSTKTITISLPLRLVAELDRVREREHRTRSEILGDALRHTLILAERDHTISVKDALPQKLAMMLAG